MTLKSKLSDVNIPQDISWPQLVFRNFESFGDKTAIIDGPSGRSYTFQQLTALTKKCASALSRKGLKKGDVFAILLPNMPEYPIIYFGVISLGGIITTLNPLYTNDEITKQLRDSNAKFIITIPLFAEKAKQSLSNVEMETVYVVGEADGCESFSTLLENGDEEFPKDVEIKPKDDIACLAYSSGTMGSPKGVMLTHYNLIADALLVTHESFLWMNEQPVVLGLLPFFHAFGQINVLSCPLLKGGTLVCVPKFEPESFLKIMQDFKVTHAALVPPTVLFLAKSPLIDQFDLSSLEDVSSGAAPLGEDLAKALTERLPSIKWFRQGYGMTELSPVSHATPCDQVKYGSVGVLLPNLECKVINVEDGTVLGPNKDGEICVRGPTVMKGYLNNQEATAQMIDSDGWLHTGDIGHYDQDEHFYITDRLKELIKCKGYQVPPAELENLLVSHPAITDAGVIGVPDSEAGELPKAYVVRKANENITEQDLVKFIEERVAPYKALGGGVQFIDEMPRSLSGKILRRKLKEMEEANVKQVQEHENLAQQIQHDDAKENGKEEDKEGEENVLKSKFADVEIPENLSWTEFVFQHFDKYGDRMAIEDCVTKRSYSFREIKVLSRKCASGLSKKGFQKGDVFALFLPNLPEFPIAFFGVLQAGGVVTAANPLFTTEELAKQLKQADAKWILTVPQLVHRAKEAMQELGRDNVLVVGEVDGYESMSELLKDDESSVPEPSINPKEDTAVIPFSSGTTGHPKGVMLTHYNLIACGSMMRAQGFLSFDETTVLLAFLPFFHSFGMVANMSMGLHTGSFLVSMPRFDKEKFLQVLEKYEVTHSSVVPPVVLLLAKHPAVDNYDLSNLTEITNGAAPLGEEISKEVMKRLPLLSRVRQGYGMTELSPVCHMTPFENNKLGSVGMLLPNLRCKVIDLETGEALGPGHDGEICVKGPTVMKGYLNNPEATAQTIDSDGWLCTGDVGHYDEDEHFFIVDRVKELIKYKGYQVPPAELEALLVSHPDIQDAAVVGVPDVEAGELPMAFVVRKPNAALTEGDVKTFVDENVAPYKKLRGGVEFIDEIPRSLSGKILRRELKDRLKDLAKTNKSPSSFQTSVRRNVRITDDGRFNDTEPLRIRRRYQSKSRCCVII
ncbi:surfactin synthase subunit 1-like [Acropora millepora]|uniref:surfactin synthase subunit 1-like n=1 Tax=Acropora millepora TaxID=45264 RepID=UPI001CF33D11|nr:surfactin synthase subunit 1-like [Acropora millepora]